VADVEPEESELSVSFDGPSVTYGFGELDTLVPAYAASIHKSRARNTPPSRTTRSVRCRASPYMMAAAALFGDQ
jgi:hypothetical protein